MCVELAFYGDFSLLKLSISLRTCYLLIDNFLPYFTQEIETVEDIQLLIIFSQSRTCQGDKNEFFYSKILKWTGMVQATIHQNWGDLI